MRFEGTQTVHSILPNDELFLHAKYSYIISSLINLTWSSCYSWNSLEIGLGHTATVLHPKPCGQILLEFRSFQSLELWWDVYTRCDITSTCVPYEPLIIKQVNIQQNDGCLCQGNMAFCAWFWVIFWLKLIDNIFLRHSIVILKGLFYLATVSCKNIVLYTNEKEKVLQFSCYLILF